MTPQALDKLWRKSQAQIPHLQAGEYADLYALSLRLHQPKARFWGVVDEKRRHNDMSIVHCFNFGNTTVKYPWQAEAVNYGMRLPLRIVRSGTVRAQKTYRTLLHQLEAPFLVFGFEDASLAEERLESGFIISEPGSAELVSEREVVMAPGFAPPDDGGLLFYFLTKRLGFTAETMDPYVLRGSEATLSRFRMRISEPMLLEPGWVLLMLEKDRWMWGVVVA
ncbi:MAG: hypothetical protein ACR2IE_05080 [Candidatus Sumerlaeaceae bacterium]